MSTLDPPQHQTPAAADLRANKVGYSVDQIEGLLKHLKEAIVFSDAASGEELCVKGKPRPWDYMGHLCDVLKIEYDEDAATTIGCALQNIFHSAFNGGSALAASPPQAETLGLIQRLRGWPATQGAGDGFSASFVSGLLNEAADAILAATAVSQPPTSRQGAGEVGDDLVQHLLAEAGGCDDLAVRASIERRFREGFAEAAMWFRKAAERIIALEAVLPAQPGPAPVGDGGAIEALVKAAWSIDSRMGSELPKSAADQLLVTPEFGITAGDLRLLLKAIRKVATRDSIPAAGGTPSTSPDFDWALVAEAVHHAASNGEGQILESYLKLAFDRCGLVVTDVPAAPTQTARDGGE